MEEYINKNDILKTLANLLESDAEDDYQFGWNDAIIRTINAIKELTSIKPVGFEEVIQEYNKRVCNAIAKQILSIKSFSDDNKEQKELNDTFSNLLRNTELR